MRTTTYLINKIPSAVIGNKTPFEVLYGKTQEYNHLKTFKCLAFASILTSNRHKFDVRAKKCIFTGYSFKIKGYKLFHEETSKIIISKNVVFHK